MGYDTTQYTLGRGVLSVALFSNGAPGSYTDVGNCSKMDLTIKEDQLEHYCSRSGMRTKDLVVTMEVGYNGTFELDQVSAANLALFVKGTTSGNDIKGLKGVDNKYALKFVSNNATGSNFTYNFWKCKISPSGSFGLITEKDWAKLTYAFEGESDIVNHADSEYFTITLMTTTTSTTTTTTTT